MDKKRLVDGTTALAEKRPRVIKIEPAERPQNVRLRVAAYPRKYHAVTAAALIAEKNKYPRRIGAVENMIHP